MKARAIIESSFYQILIISTAYMAVFYEPLLGIWKFSSSSISSPGVQDSIFIIDSIIVSFFFLDFILSYKIYRHDYLKSSDSWINLLIFLEYLLVYGLEGDFPNPLVLRIFRAVATVSRLGLLEKAGRMPGNLVSKDLKISNEDDIKFSLVLFFCLAVLGGDFSLGNYQTQWDPIKELTVYCLLLLAIKIKVQRNLKRINEVFINPLNKISKENFEKLEFILGDRLHEGTLEQLRSPDKNEFELIIEQINLIFDNLKKFVSNRTLRESRGEEVIPTDQAIALMFSDVQGFTRATTAMQLDIIPVLGKYLESMCEEVITFNGDIEKFVGDAIFAYFYNEDKPDNSVNQCFDAAIMMFSQNEELSMKPSWIKLFEKNDWKSFVYFKTRFGLHYGTVTAGPIGSIANQHRAESTLVGDNVNITSRIESLGKQYGVYFLVTEEFFLQLSENRRAMCRFVDYVTLKGREQQPFKIYTIDIEENSEKFLEFFKEGQDYYFKGEWSSALSCFEAAIKIQQDGPTETFIRRIKEVKTFSLKALDHINRGLCGKMESFQNLKPAIEESISKELYVPPKEFIERGGFWRWEIK